MKKETLEEYIWEIQFYWKKFIYWPYREIVNGIRALIYWLPVIWKSRDWDYQYTYEILQHQLKRQRLDLERDIFVGSLREAKHVRTCELLLQRLMDDDYFDFPEVRRRQEINRKRSYVFETSLKQQDKDLLYKLLNKHLDKWWT